MKIFYATAALAGYGISIYIAARYHTFWATGPSLACGILIVPALRSRS